MQRDVRKDARRMGLLRQRGRFRELGSGMEEEEDKGADIIAEKESQVRLSGS